MKLFSPKRAENEEEFNRMIFDINEKNYRFYKKGALIHFKQVNAYGAFRHDVVKEILNSADFGVSPMHFSLNKIYFSPEHKSHQHNKRTAIKHLDFLSKDLQHTKNDFLWDLCHKLSSHFPLDQPFNLVDLFINPAVFINALKDLGFLGALKVFNPDDPDFSFDIAIEKIKEAYRDKGTLYLMIQECISRNEIPDTMRAILREMESATAGEEAYFAQYFTSMIYANVETLSSFVASFLQTVLVSYPGFIYKNDTRKIEETAHEVLRIYTPTPIAFRSVKETMLFHGTHLKQGDLIMLFLGAANKDPRYFPSPDKIVFDRAERHLAFGRGRLACIGQFASFRTAVNMLDFLAQRKGRLILTDKEPQHKIVNGMLRQENLNAIAYD